jgi:Holliday junction resolvase RusA-like endonuclease
MMNFPVTVTIDVYPKDARLRDVDGYLKLVLDMLESCRVIENDRLVQLLLVERHPPRGEHEIEIQVSRYSPGRDLPAL